MKVRERDGPRGGEYFDILLPDGRAMSVSRKPEDKRVWLGWPDDKSSWQDQRGGVGTIPKLLDEWRARAALDEEGKALYSALVALDNARRASQ